MEEAYQHHLMDLLEITEKVYSQAKTIDAQMELNSEEQLEELQLLFERRQRVIQQLALFINQQEFKWAEEDRITICKLKDYETLLEPLINGLHMSFKTQLSRISQTKQASKKYSGAYKTIAANGSFFDKRK